MTLQTKARIEVHPLSPALGAEIRGVDLAQPMDDAAFAEILQAWHDHGLILLRGQTFDEDQQVAFGRRFGPVAPWSRFAVKEKGRHPYIMLVTNLKENGEFVGSLPEGEIEFHSDGIYIEQPSAGTMLHAVAIPSKGGQTAFSNMYKVYETLPDALKAKLAGLKARHAFTYNSQKKDENDRKKADADIASFEHPVVRTHPATGRKALYVNRLMTEEIVGLPADESRRVLDALFAQIERPEFIYEHEWRVGDVLLWDNRCLTHARRDFPAEELRLMRRLTIAGERPV
ncbi:MAG TPA: TauD/TfdA family dioxygenase [Alphaproteobacteria bacterium]|jgi:taurine dioxygenase